MGAGKTTVGALLAEPGPSRPATPTPTSRPRRAAPSPTSSSTRARRTSARWSAPRSPTALAAHDGVLALGGGAVLDPGTRALLAGHAGGLPAGRPQRRGEAGRAGQRPAAAARQRPRPDQGAARRAHAGLRVASPSLVVDTDGRTPEDVAARDRGGAGMSDGSRRTAGGRRRASPCCTSAARRRTTSWSGTGLAGRLPQLLGDGVQRVGVVFPEGARRPGPPVLDALAGVVRGHWRCRSRTASAPRRPRWRRSAGRRSARPASPAPTRS